MPCVCVSVSLGSEVCPLSAAQGLQDELWPGSHAGLGAESVTKGPSCARAQCLEKETQKRSFRFTSWIIPSLGVKQSSSIVGFPGLSTESRTAAGLFWSFLSPAQCGQSQGCSLL